MSDNTININIERLMELELQKKEIEKQIDAIKKDFATLMDQTEELTTNKYTLKYTLCERNTIDGAGLKAFSKELYNQFLKATYYRRFSYKTI